MPIYDFENRSIQVPERINLPGVPQSSHVQGGRYPNALLPIDFPTQVEHEDVEEFISPGWEPLDAAMKTYWSDIRVPTKDGYRFMRVKIAGGDKSLLVWRDELKNGRVQLPVAAIDHESEEFLRERFSPPYAHVSKKFINKQKDLVSLLYRPVPYLVKYKLIIWTEHKIDMQNILHQVLTRFNPNAEFRMSDNHVVGNVLVKFGGSTDSTNKEASSDAQRVVRQDIGMEAEAWLPLPEKVAPVILGQVKYFGERVGFAFD